MRLIKLSEYNRDTMQLAKPIMDAKGRVLLAAGNSIHPKYLKKIEELGIRYLVVEDAESKGITLEEMLDMPTWMDAIQAVKNTFEQVMAKKAIPLQALQQVAGRLMLEVRNRPAILLVPSTSQSTELRPYAHAVNVTLLALQIAKQLKLTDIELRDLALGCLLHDIGKAVTSDQAEHPEAGFNILRTVRELSLLSAHVAFQHHETLNGMGYPRQLTGDSFLLFAQICGAANLYENAISAQGIPPHEALEMMMTMYGIQYPETVVDAMIKGIPAYPPGTKVLLQANEVAIVTRIDTHMQRPRIRILATQEEISLADEPTVLIQGLVEETPESTLV